MKNNRILGIVAWTLGLVLSMFFLIFIPKEWTGTACAVTICTVVVYLLHLILWMLLQKGKLDFHNLSALSVSVFFLLVQTVWAVVAAFASEAISTKTSVVVSVLLIIAQALIVVLALVSKNHIESVSSRQKDHHVEL